MRRNISALTVIDRKTNQCYINKERSVNQSFVEERKVHSMNSISKIMVTVSVLLGMCWFTGVLGADDKANWPHWRGLNDNGSTTEGA